MSHLLRETTAGLQPITTPEQFALKHQIEAKFTQNSWHFPGNLEFVQLEFWKTLFRLKGQ